MKIRQGFVSNSSTTSFLIYGFSANNPDFDGAVELLINFKKENEDIFNTNINKIIAKYENRANKWAAEKVEVYKLIRLINHPDILKDNKEIIKRHITDEDTLYGILGLEYHCTDYSNYVGRSWDSVRDDETGAEFKASVEKVAKHFGEGIKCGTIEEAWYNG